MTGRYVDGEIGPRTMEAAHLFGKSDNYRRGYAVGKERSFSRLHRHMDYVTAQIHGGDYLRGYFFGVRVRRHGIKQALRKARR